MKIFLDMDGVLVDFVKGAVPYFNADYDELIAKWTPGTYDMENILGISKSEFFRTIDEAGADFWANLPPYPYARDLYNHCAAIAPTYILTAPTLHPSSLAGKLTWLHNWFGKGFREYAMAPHKEMCANPTHVLIDDHVPNVEKFMDAGGHAILWPTLFNYRFKEADNCFEVAKQELDKTTISIVECRRIMGREGLV